MPAFVLAVDQHCDLDVVRMYADDATFEPLSRNGHVIAKFQLGVWIVSCHGAILPLSP